MKNKSFGDILSEARKKEKISQNTLSQKLHISRQSISNWENDYNVPDLDMLRKICQILKLNYNEIIQMNQFSNKIKNNKENKLVILLVVVIMSLIIFCFVLVRFRTRLVVYDVLVEDNDILSLNNGIFIKTNSSYYFRLGTLKLKDEDINDYRIRIYYKTDDDVRLLIESNCNENIFIDENNGYEEYFENDLSKSLVYIDLISLKDSKITSTFKLEFKKILKNEKIINIKSPKIGKKQCDYDKLSKKLITTESLEKHNYKLEFDKYTKKIQNGTFKFDDFLNTLFFFNASLKLEYNLTNEYFVGTEYDYETKKIITNFTFDENTKRLTCFSESCDNYKNYIKILKDEVDLLVT